MTLILANVDPRQTMDGIVTSPTPITPITSPQKSLSNTISSGRMVTKSLYIENGRSWNMEEFTSWKCQSLFN